MANAELINLDVTVPVDHHLYRDGKIRMYNGIHMYKHYVIPKPSEMIHVAQDCRGYISAPEYIAEVVDCGVCGSLTLGWTLCTEN